MYLKIQKNGFKNFVTILVLTISYINICDLYINEIKSTNLELIKYILFGEFCKKCNKSCIYIFEK